MPYVDFVPSDGVVVTPKNRVFEDFVPEPKPQSHKEVESTEQDKVDEVAEVPAEPKKPSKKKK